MQTKVSLTRYQCEREADRLGVVLDWRYVPDWTLWLNMDGFGDFLLFAADHDVMLFADDPAKQDVRDEYRRVRDQRLSA